MITNFHKHTQSYQWWWTPLSNQIHAQARWAFRNAGLQAGEPELVPEMLTRHRSALLCCYTLKERPSTQKQHNTHQPSTGTLPCNKPGINWTSLSCRIVLSMSARLGGVSAVESRERGSPISNNFTFSRMLTKGEHYTQMRRHLQIWLNTPVRTNSFKGRWWVRVARFQISPFN